MEIYCVHKKFGNRLFRVVYDKGGVKVVIQDLKTGFMFEAYRDDLTFITTLQGTRQIQSK